MVVVKGRGYPDVATRDFLAKLSDRTPMLALVDFDPPWDRDHGFDAVRQPSHGARGFRAVCGGAKVAGGWFLGR